MVDPRQQNFTRVRTLGPSQDRRLWCYVRKIRVRFIGEQVIHPVPPFFCNLQLKVTLQTLRLLLAQKFSKTPQLLGGLCPIPHCTSHVLFSKNTYCIKLSYFEFDCLDCYSSIFAPPPKNRSCAYTADSQTLARVLNTYLRSETETETKTVVQVVEVNASEVNVEFTAGQGGQTQRGFLIKSEGNIIIIFV